MTDEQAERIAQALERIASSLEATKPRITMNGRAVGDVLVREAFRRAACGPSSLVYGPFKTDEAA